MANNNGRPTYTQAMMDVNERVARLEERVDSLREGQQRILDKLDQVLGHQTDHEVRLSTLEAVEPRSTAKEIAKIGAIATVVASLIEIVGRMIP